MTHDWFVLVVLALAAIGGAVKIREQVAGRRNARRLLDQSPQSFRDHERVTLSGTAKLVGAGLVAPISGRPCVAYRAVARTYIVTSRNRRFADQQLVEAKLAPFVLVTKDGEVVVDGELVDIPIRGEPVIPRKLERERAFLDRAGLAEDVAHASFEEVRIEPGMKIRVNGEARIELATSGETSFREAPRKITLGGNLTIVA